MSRSASERRLAVTKKISRLGKPQRTYADYYLVDAGDRGWGVYLGSVETRAGGVQPEM